MRKALCLVFLGCALVVGLACSDSGDSTTPTAPATTGLQSATGASVTPSKIYLCHGLPSDDGPFGVVVEVTNIFDKRHKKHLNIERDCACTNDSIAGEECVYIQDPYSDVSCLQACPSNE